MIALALSICLGASPGAGLQVGDTLPPGLHSAGIILLACQAVDKQPMVLADPDIGSIGIDLLVPLRIDRSTINSLEVALRAAGIFRVSYRDAAGNAYRWITRDPQSRPKEATPYEVLVVRLRHLDAKTAATALNGFVEANERNVDGVRTRFIAYENGNRLIARYSSRELLDRYLEELRKLDAPPEPKQPRRVMRSYLCQKRLASEIEEEFRARWDDESGEEITVVVQKGSNSILLRLPEPLWERAKAILEDLDRVPIPIRD